jgi:dTDP-glucose 4,6-dehydratase
MVALAGFQYFAANDPRRPLRIRSQIAAIGFGIASFFCAIPLQKNGNFRREAAQNRSEIPRIPIPHCRVEGDPLETALMANPTRPTSVVTGGAGFLGSHLTDRLLAEGHRVIGIDNFLTGSTANIEHLAGNERYKFIKHDVSNYIFLPDEVDFVFHFASPASPVDYLEYPIPTLKVGSLGTHNALGLAKAKNATFLIASTSECYGDPLVHPQREDYWGNVNPIGPRGVYDEAKRFAEAMTMAYHRYHRVNTKIVRIFNTYGPRMRLRDGRVVPAFIGQALTGEPLTIFGDGSQTRSFCYVSDLIDGIFKLAMSDFHEPVNIGNPREMTIKQFAEEIIRITGTASQIEHRPLPVDDPKVRQPDITRARSVLQWEPRVDFDEGIRKTIDYFRTRVG